MTLSKTALTCPSCVFPKKSLNPKLKTYQYFLIETTRLSEFLEGFNSSVALPAGKSCPNTCLPKLDLCWTIASIAADGAILDAIFTSHLRWLNNRPLNIVASTVTSHHHHGYVSRWVTWLLTICALKSLPSQFSSVLLIFLLWCSPCYAHKCYQSVQS